MKVYLDTIAKALVGKIGKLVFYRYKKSGVLMARADFKRKIDHTNIAMKNKSANLGAFYRATSLGYRRDLLNYATQLNLETIGENCIYNAYNVFIKMMYALKKEYPAIELSAITPQDVMDDGLPVRTVREAIESELLPTIPYYETMTHEILID